MCFITQTCTRAKKINFPPFSASCVHQSLLKNGSRRLLPHLFDSFLPPFRRLMPGVKRISSTWEMNFPRDFMQIFAVKQIDFDCMKKSNRKTDKRGEFFQQSTKNFLSVKIFVFIHRWLKYQRSDGEWGKRLNSFPETSAMLQTFEILRTSERQSIFHSLLDCQT
jgi:hypothetical protein